MRFSKMQGVGNDFVVVELTDTVGIDLSSLAQSFCMRQLSIGADGLLVIGPGDKEASFSFRMFNPDGSEDMCGNGLRCACLWAFRHALASVGQIPVLTKDGVRECSLISADSKSAQVTVDMGPARLKLNELPMSGPPNNTFIASQFSVANRSYTATVVNTGSTHTVIFLDDNVGEEEFEIISPLIEKNPLFPDRTSVLWATPIGPGHFGIRIWERGAGETLGCGTGACAVGVAAVLNGLAMHGDTVAISSKGGTLQIRWSEDIWMTGPAVHVFEGDFPVLQS